MSSYPVLFSYRDLIMGRDFVAYVEADGRALLRKEEDCYWADGVCPGALSAGGKEISETNREFKKRYLSVLFDIAEEAETFSDFKREVEAFFNECDEQSAADWDAAHASVKEGKLTSGELPQRAASARPPRITVQKVDPNAKHEPASFNRFDEDLVNLAEAA